MNYIVNANLMKKIDKATIEEHNIPSLVLMERAALSVVNTMESEKLCDGFTTIVCGTGNNAADGVAIARMLCLKGKSVAVILVGDSERHTDELTSQINSAVSYGVPFYEFSLSKDKCSELINNADTVVDAIFGIGLSRAIEGDFAEIINAVNVSSAKVISVDMPSGYNTDTGVCLNAGIKADITVCFSYLKKGLLLSDCYLNAGKVVVTDVGIYLEDKNTDVAYQITDEELTLIHKKAKGANKGTNAKILVIAGSEDIYGACYLSALAAMKAGAGYVKIFTHKNNIATLQDKLPEAVCISYDESLLENFRSFEADGDLKECIIKEDKIKSLKAAIDFADAVVIGPGLSTSELSKEILEFTIKNVNKPLIIDADGINLIAADNGLLAQISEHCRQSGDSPVIITPHLAEMGRLTGKSIKELNDSMEENAITFSREYGIVTVLKNYTTVITDGKRVFINNSGDESLATAGSGDVLSGIVTAFAGMKMDCCLSAALAAYVHGKAGVKASNNLNTKNVLAGEVALNILKSEI